MKFMKMTFGIGVLALGIASCGVQLQPLRFTIQYGSAAPS